MRRGAGKTGGRKVKGVSWTAIDRIARRGNEVFLIAAVIREDLLSDSGCALPSRMALNFASESARALPSRGHDLPGIFLRESARLVPVI